MVVFAPADVLLRQGAGESFYGLLLGESLLYQSCFCEYGGERLFLAFGEEAVAGSFGQSGDGLRNGNFLLGEVQDAGRGEAVA